MSQEGVNSRTTTMFMKSPAGCIFICIEADLAGLRGLALPLNRKDVQLETVDLLTPGKPYAGTGWPKDVVVDWQVKLTPTQEAVLRRHREFVLTYRPPHQEQLT